MAALALGGPTYLSPKEISERLTLREFLKLCACVDSVYGKTISEVSGAEGAPKCADRREWTKFDVLDIVREPELNVTISADDRGAARFTIK